MERDVRLIRNALFILVAIIGVYIVKELASLLIPLVLALFLGILLRPSLVWLQERRIPFSLSVVVVMLFLGFLFTMVGQIIYQTGWAIIAEQDRLLVQLEVKLHPILHDIEEMTGFETGIHSGGVVVALQKFISLDWLIRSSGTFATIIGDFTSLLFMTLLYLLMILGGILNYKPYILYLEKDSQFEGTLLRAYEDVQASITTYMKVKFWVSLGTGLGYWLLCLIFGVDFAIFWGFLAFILNFVPTVGSIVATAPPLLLGWIQIEAYEALILFGFLLIAIQFVLGNVVDPLLMGNSLSINTVVIILGLVFWGYLWGITGMILSVPLLVLIKVIFQQIPDARFLVRLMDSSP
ncbi:MAG: AI-2E family transporter [Chitinophagales bacterium]